MPSLSSQYAGGFLKYEIGKNASLQSGQDIFFSLLVHLKHGLCYTKTSIIKGRFQNHRSCVLLLLFTILSTIPLSDIALIDKDNEEEEDKGQIDDSHVAS